MAKWQPDYVVIGAGSAGCTLAARLTEDADVRVLLLEAGGWDSDPLIHVPLGYGRILAERRHDWMFDTDPVDGLDGRVLPCERGKVVGGSSSTNAMVYVRGNRGDYDRWEAAGLDRFAYRRVLPYFRRSETWEGGESRYRGGSGPLATRWSRYDDPLSAAGLEAADRAGFPSTEDYNAASQEGFSRLQSTIGRGRRASAATAYLGPALRRGNLRVLTGVQATAITFEGTTASGVSYRRTGRQRNVRAAREVILAAGAIQSPHLLMLSGIGDGADLRRHGVAVRADLPGVGRNLQDHVQAGFEYARVEPGPFARALRLDRIGPAMANAYLAGRGFATDLPSGWTAFLRSPLAGLLPDIQLLFRATPPVAAPYLPPFRPAFADGFACRAVLLRPESRGSVSLRSADPTAAPRIMQSFLATDRDRATLRAGLRLVRDLAAHAPFADFIAREIEPGPAVNRDADLDAHIRASAGTVRHPLGTCRMGTDGEPTTVVDQDFRVRGVSGLRVVDASVLPDLLGGNINAVVIMAAEMAADLIGGRPPLAAAA